MHDWPLVLLLAACVIGAIAVWIHVLSPYATAYQDPCLWVRGIPGCW